MVHRVVQRKVPPGRDVGIYNAYVEKHTTISMNVETKEKLDEIVWFLKDDPSSDVDSWDDFMMKTMYPILKEVKIPPLSEFYKPPKSARYTSVWVSRNMVDVYQREILPKFTTKRKHRWQPCMAYILDWWNKNSGSGGSSDRESESD